MSPMSTFSSMSGSHSGHGMNQAMGHGHGHGPGHGPGHVPSPDPMSSPMGSMMPTGVSCVPQRDSPSPYSCMRPHYETLGLSSSLSGGLSAGLSSGLSSGLSGGLSYGSRPSPCSMQTAYHHQYGSALGTTGGSSTGEEARSPR